MATSQALFGTTYQIPITPERFWGTQVRTYLLALGRWANTVGYLTSSNVGLFVAEATSSTLAAAATLTPTHPTHQVEGSGGAVTLDGTTAIADGEIDQQQLILIGQSDTNTVLVPESANTALNGPCLLALGDVLTLGWDETASVWRELSRSN